MKNEYDITDLRILREIREDCNISVKEMARKTDIHPNTVMQRIKKLRDTGVIVKNQSEIDYSRLGFGMQALIQIRIRMCAGWEDQIKNVKKIPFVAALYAVTGGPDVVAVVHLRDKKDLADVLRLIQKNKVVANTTTMIIVDSYKQPYEFNPLVDEVLINETVDRLG